MIPSTSAARATTKAKDTAEESKPEAMADKLPEGFFDDAKMDAKVGRISDQGDEIVSRLLSVIVTVACLLCLISSCGLLCMLAHTYPHKPQRKNKMTICNHQADSPLYLRPSK